ncbi:MAG: TrbC/VirB2 family protein [Patescibacteria group bacterium]|nr:TrbC/VirB2 family protein [Patescibacteria group bacterium]
MKKLFVNLSAWLAGSILLLPLPAMAQSSGDIGLGDALQSGGIDSLTGIIDNAIQIIAGIAGAIAVGYLVYGGITYITGGAKGAETAKQIIINAIIGMVVILLAYVIATSVVDLFRT